MSIDERLRTGLSVNTDHLDPDLDRELVTVFRRVHRRRQARVGGMALLAAAVLAAIAWLGDVPGLERGSGPPQPIDTPTALAPRSMEGLDGPLSAGPWVVPMWGKDSDVLPRAVVDVPAGFGSPGGWVVDRGADGDPQNYGTVSFWTAERVVTDPCAGVTGDDPGPGVRDLADALHALPVVTSSEPTPVTVDGHTGLYLEVTFPRDETRVKACHSSEYDLWLTDSAVPYGTDIGGTVSRLWILDVGGTRVVMVADTTPHEDAAATAKVLGIAHSVRFIEPLKPRR
jgi:hypothetical protein